MTSECCFFTHVENCFSYHRFTAGSLCFFFFSSRRRHTRSLCDWRFRRVLFRSDRKSVVEGKSVDLGGRRIIKKKKWYNMMRKREIPLVKESNDLMTLKIKIVVFSIIICSPTE